MSNIDSPIMKRVNRPRNSMQDNDDLHDEFNMAVSQLYEDDKMVRTQNLSRMRRRPSPDTMSECKSEIRGAINYDEESKVASKILGNKEESKEYSSSESPIKSYFDSRRAESMQNIHLASMTHSKKLNNFIDNQDSSKKISDLAQEFANSRNEWKLTDVRKLVQNTVSTPMALLVPKAKSFSSDVMTPQKSKPRFSAFGKRDKSQTSKELPLQDLRKSE